MPVHPRLPLVVLCLLLPFLAGVSDAIADEWSDTKKAFRKAQRSDEMPIRRGSYIDLLTYDGTERTNEAIDELFRALTKEESPAVVLTGIDTLSTFTSAEATTKIVDTVRRGRGARRLFALIALADRLAGGGEEILLEILQGKEEELVCQAALALGRRQHQPALPHLLRLLDHDTWQIRAAAARSLKLMAGKAVLNSKTGLEELPPAPAWLKTKEILQTLATSLESAEGRARGDVIAALERITDARFGYDVRAWKQLAEGRAASEITPIPPRIPYIFGMPIYGRKVVVLIDISTCTDSKHPFESLERKKEVLRVPNARPVALPTITTTKEFYAAHAKRLIKDLPTRGHKFEVIAVFTEIEGVFDKLAPVNSGTQRQAITFIDELNVQGGPNHYVGLNRALDISGSKDSVAWSLGPDEIVLMTCAIPWAPRDPNAMVDQSEVGAAIGLKARLRMVPIHTVGVGPHPYEMMRQISEQSGGRYLDLSR